MSATRNTFREDGTLTRESLEHILSHTPRDFSPYSMQQLRLYFGRFPRDDRMVDKFALRFASSDIAWMAGGLWNDGQHHAVNGKFHALHTVTRAETTSSEERKAVRKLLLETVLDVVSLFDVLLISTIKFTHCFGRLQQWTAFREV